MACKAPTIGLRHVQNLSSVKSLLGLLPRINSVSPQRLFHNSCHDCQPNDRFGQRLAEGFSQNPRNQEEMDRLGMTGLLKKNRMYAQYNYQEWRFPMRQRPIDVSCTRMIFREYEDKGALASRLRDPRKEFEDKRIEFFSTRAIKKRVPNFHQRRFPTEAQEIYLKVHELLNSENWFIAKKEQTEEELHGLVTEFAYPKILQGLDKKTVVWKFVESIEPPRTVQVFAAPMMHKDNLYGQVTVRFHTKQILTLYDRMGRLMMGSPTEPRDVLEYVTFERHIVDSYGKWRIHGKKVIDNKTKDNLERTIAIRRRKPERIAQEEWHKKEEEIQPYKWYPARERLIKLQNRPFKTYQTKRQRVQMRKNWVLSVKLKRKLRMKRRDMKHISRKSNQVYQMRQSGELPKPPM